MLALYCFVIVSIHARLNKQQTTDARHDSGCARAWPPRASRAGQSNRHRPQHGSNVVADDELEDSVLLLS